MAERSVGRGDSGPEVVAIQALLVLLGHDPGPRDGEFGERTEEAVRSYEERLGIPPTGAVDPQDLVQHAIADGPIRPSASVARELDSLEPVTAAELAVRLYRSHSSYPLASEAVAALELVPTSARVQPPVAWVADAISALDVSSMASSTAPTPSSTPELHGQLLIYALARIEPDLGAAMERAGLLEPLRKSITPPPDTLFAARAPSGARLDAQLVSDEPATVDQLDRQPFGRAFATLLRRQREGSFGSGPILVHLYGPWGSGKSSLYNWVRAELCEETRPPGARGPVGDPSSGPWLCVTFNAWRHQRTAPPWWWLIDSVYHEARRKGEGSLDTHTRRKVWWWRWGYVVLAVVFATIFLALAAVVGLAISDLFDRLQGTLEAGLALVSAITAVLIGLRTARSSLLLGSPRSASFLVDSGGDPLRKVHDRYVKLIEEIDRPVLVYVDDLDRCQAEYVVDLLEGINTVLLTKVTYLVAADREWLCESFEHQYSSYSGVMGRPGRPLGYLFLEKTFAVSAPIPTPRPMTRARYWRTVLGAPPTSAGDGQEGPRPEDLKTATSAEAVAAAANVAEDDTVYARSVREQAAMRVAEGAAQGDFDHLLEPYLPLMEANPRALKRLRNAYAVNLIGRVIAGTAAVDPVSEDGLVRWCILGLRWPRLANAIAERPTLLDNVADRVADLLPADLKPLVDDHDVHRLLAHPAGKRPATLREWVAIEFAEAEAAEVEIDVDAVALPNVDLRLEPERR